MIRKWTVTATIWIPKVHKKRVIYIQKVLTDQPTSRCCMVLRQWRNGPWACHMHLFPPSFSEMRISHFHPTSPDVMCMVQNNNLGMPTQLQAPPPLATARILPLSWPVTTCQWPSPLCLGRCYKFGRMLLHNKLKMHSELQSKLILLVRLAINTYWPLDSREDTEQEKEMEHGSWAVGVGRQCTFKLSPGWKQCTSCLPLPSTPGPHLISPPVSTSSPMGTVCEMRS